MPTEDQLDDGADELDLAAAPAAEPDRTEAPRRGRSGVAGSMLAGALLGLRDALEGPPKEQIVIQVDASGDPPDIDVTGLDDSLDPANRMTGPPLDDLKAKATAARRRRRRS